MTNIELKTNEPKVLIRLPELVVSRENASEYLCFLNKVVNDLKNMYVTALDNDEEVYTRNDVYVGGKCVPVITKHDEFTNILDLFKIEVEQMNKYVEIDTTDYYSIKDEILQTYETEPEEE